MLRTRFTADYGLEAPIALAGMGFISTPRLAAAVANGGGFGSVAAGLTSPGALRNLIATTRSMTDRPFGLNFIVETTAFGPLTSEEHIDVCVTEDVPVVSFFWNLPPVEWLMRLKNRGCRVWFQTSSIPLALEAVAMGADLVIAQGEEAGGHNKANTGLFVLLPAMIDALGGKVPVLAAGGIADGRGLAAALCLGADGVWMGTRFLATEESNAHPTYKQRVVEAGPGDLAKTFLFGPEWPDAPMRVIRNRVVREWAGRDSATPSPPDSPQKIGTTKIGDMPYDMPKFAAILPTPETDGDFEEMCLAAGESAALIHDVVAAGEVVRRIAAETMAILDARAR